MDLSKSYEFFNPSNFRERIHIIGCGSVGSTVAENLARYGITKFSLYDFDIVEAKNIVNQMFVNDDIKKPKIECVRDIILRINPDAAPDIKMFPDGWVDNPLSGYVFLAVDDIDLRRKIAEENVGNNTIKGFFDFRTGLLDAQHYAANWKVSKSVEDFIGTMNFTNEDAKRETPVSACGTTLSVAATVRIISALGVANFINFVVNGDLKKCILIDTKDFILDSF